MGCPGLTLPQGWPDYPDCATGPRRYSQIPPEGPGLHTRNQPVPNMVPAIVNRHPLKKPVPRAGNGLVATQTGSSTQLSKHGKYLGPQPPMVVVRSIDIQWM